MTVTEKFQNNCVTLGEAIACSNLGSCYVVLGQGPAAIGYYQLAITLFNDIRNRLKLSDEWKISLRDQYKTKRNLKIAKEMCDRWGEKRAFQNLGMIAGQNLGDLKTAVNFNERFQKIAKELGDGLGEGEACRQLGIAHHSLGNFQIAIDYHERQLKIAKELGEISWEGMAYCNLGNAHLSLGNIRTAIDYQERCLKIAKELGDKSEESMACGNLACAHYNLGDFITASLASPITAEEIFN